MSEILIKVILTLLFSVFTLVVLLFVGIPILIYRQGVIYLAWIFRKRLLYPVPPLSNILASENVFCEDASTMILSMQMEKEMDLEILRELVLRRGVLGRFDNGACALIDPQLQCTIQRFLGYAFYCQLDNFDVSKSVYQIETLEEIGFTEAETSVPLSEIMNKLPRKPWRRELPLWEIIVIPPHLNTDSGGHNEMVFRVHHALGDGFAILKLFGRIFPNNLNFTNENNPVKTEKGKEFLQKFLLFSRIPWDYVSFTYNNHGGKYWDFQKSGRNSKSVKCSRLFGNYTGNYPVEDMRKIRTDFGVDVTSIMLSSIATAMRQIILKRDGEIQENMKINVAFTIQMPGFTEQMDNNVSFITIPLPVGEPDGVKRLFKISKIIKEIKKSSVSFGVFYGYKFLGLFPTNLLEILRMNGDTGPPALAVNVLGTQRPFLFSKDNSILRYFAGFNSVPDCNGLMFRLMFYRGEVRMGFHAGDKHIYSREEAREIIQTIEKHFEYLTEFKS